MAGYPARVSNTEILKELPALPPHELAAIWQSAGELLEGRVLSVSPELLAAVDEADVAWEREGGISIAEARRKIGA